MWAAPSSKFLKMAGGPKSLATPGLNNQECRHVVNCIFIYFPNFIGTEKKASIKFLGLCRASCNGSAQFNSNLDVESLDHEVEPVLEGQLILKHGWVQKWSVSREKYPAEMGLTGVSLVGTNFTLLMTEHRAIFISSMANLMPMQLHGPNPKGAYAYGSILCLFSGDHLLGWSLFYFHVFSHRYTPIIESSVSDFRP